MKALWNRLSVGGKLCLVVIAAYFLCAAWGGARSLSARLADKTPAYNVVDVPARYQRPSADHWMGTDNLGRDVSARLVQGAWISFQVGIGTSLIAIPLGVDIRFFRTAVLDEIYKPYVRTARAKGLSGPKILVKHVLRNSLIPIVTYVSLSIPYLFTGSLLLETFFGIPGLGSVSLNAINSADLAVVRAVVLLGALLYQVVNLVTDLAYAALDPRVRLG